MRKQFPLKKILILVAILAVPGFLYYLLQDKGKNRYKPLPFYGPKTVLETFKMKRGEKIPDTLYHMVPGFTGFNQEGQDFDFSKITDNIVIANFFYTKSGKLGEEMNKQMDWLYNRYINNKAIRLVSISIDPENDKGELLKHYADSLKAKAGKWDFVSIDTSAVYQLSSEGFFVNAFKSDGKYILSEKIILLDKQHRIRGYYNSLQSEDMKSLNDQIKVLITEELRKMP
ncbi:electron transport protein SCO1/SenC [Pseudopedobacter saltans DSM 12145]|uniref:Electron transport protein SCO1/SenC n=1 Tax=Pseudopedobacter saltans (strain ATCC 51119 / DSM 12145 / JCM 21818 / CCUG 39354 / LMG 10337 / NBRC 100064 / NCIMB 13643) TaxID=762903 RepID=F0S5J3_PSESL|nr:SCO family protein [Pseudopedobacter saltans]ADY53157.1 electron transport protein SCO1/SenC [Pseudopedobacter saltans DSM 12145]